MGDISSIVLPSGDSYTFKDNDSIHGFSYSNGKLTPIKRDGTDGSDVDLYAPFLTKTYIGLLGTASNSAANDSFYFMRLRPTDFYAQWMVRYSVEAVIDGHPEYHATSDVTLYGIGQATAPVFYIYNRIYSTSYRPYYFHNFYRLTSAGFSNASLSNAIGLGLRSSNARNAAGYERTVTVKVYEAKNCTVSLLDTPVKWANWTDGTTTNYAGLSEFDGYNNGLRETGDDNTNTYDRRYLNTAKIVAGGYGIFPYSLIMRDANGSWQSITTTGGIGTTKAVNTTGFLPGFMYQYSYSNTIATGSITSNNYLYETNVVDARYTFNCSDPLVINQSLYLVGVIRGGLFYVDDAMYSQVLPTSDDGKYYMYLGEVYSTSSFDLTATHPIFFYRNGGIKELSTNAHLILDHNSSASVIDTFSSLDSIPCFSHGVCMLPQSISPTESSLNTYVYICYGNSFKKVLRLFDTAGTGTEYVKTKLGGSSEWQDEYASLISCFCGIAAVPSTINSAFVTGLSTATSSIVPIDFSVNATSGKYIWFAVPTRFGNRKLYVDGFCGGFEPPSTVSVTVGSKTEDYYVYRSTNPSLGECRITVY